MALFKILSNMDDTSKSLPSSYIKGYCYFDVNSGKFWIDTKDNDSTGRLPLNAYKADRDSDGNLIKTNYIRTGAPSTQTITITGGTSSVPLSLIGNTSVKGCTIRFSTEQDGLLGELGIFQGYPTYKDSNGYKRLLTWDNFSINGKTPAGASYAFYAPTSSGTSNQVLVSRGNEQSPTWTNSLTLTTLNIGTTSSTTGSQLIYGRLGTDNTTKYQANTYMSGGGTYFIDIITNGATPASNRFWLSATETGSTIPINAARGLISAADNRLFLEPGDNDVAMLAVYTNGVRAYGIHRNADSNSLKAHYYTNDGTWAAGYTLLDENNYRDFVTLDYLPLSGGTLTGDLTVTSTLTVSAQDNSHEGGEIILLPATSSYKTGHVDLYDNKIRLHDGTSEYFTVDLSTGVARANTIYGAVWNDYAEYRNQNEIIEPGYITYCDDDGKLKKTTERLQKFEGIVSDTFGFAIGETDDCKTPLAVSGRALVYCDPEEEHFHSGDCVCAGPDGLAYRMTREEIIEFPDRIVGIISEIPTYETWGTGNVKVNGRIWVKVR